MSSNGYSKVATWVDDGDAFEMLVRISLTNSQTANGDAFRTIHHKPVDPDTLSLAITHELRKGRTWQSMGAGVPDVPDSVTWRNGWDRAKYERLQEFSQDWHLNDLRAGCAHQTVVYETDRFGRSVPSLSKTEECPLTGYRYGQAWLVAKLPEEVVHELYELGAVRTEKDWTERKLA